MSQKKIKTSVIESKSVGLYEAYIFVTGVNPKISPPADSFYGEVIQTLHNNNEKELADFLCKARQLFYATMALTGEPLTVTYELTHGRLTIRVKGYDCDELSRFTEMVESYFNDIVQA